MKSVMVDIETLSTRKDAVVISIGVAAFDDSKVIQTAGWALDFAHLVEGHIDPKTVKWWSEQHECARTYSFNGRVRPAQAAGDFRMFLQQYGGEELWANDPTFDVVILRNWWDRAGGGGDFPSHYRHERSCRTIFAEARRLGHNIDSAWANGSVAHNPVDDAANQARGVILARKALGGVSV